MYTVLIYNGEVCLISAFWQPNWKYDIFYD